MWECGNTLPPYLPSEVIFTSVQFSTKITYGDSDNIYSYKTASQITYFSNLNRSIIFKKKTLQYREGRKEISPVSSFNRFPLSIF
jgi:hypothetical protein